MSKELYALGIGHNSPVFIDLALACGYQIAGLYHYNDTRTGEIDHGYEILGSFDDLFAKESLEGMSFLLTMGDNRIRTELSDKRSLLTRDVPPCVVVAGSPARILRDNYSDDSSYYSNNNDAAMELFEVLFAQY